MRAVQAGHWQHVVNDLDRVVTQDADVVEVLLSNAFEQGTNPGLVHLAAQKMVIGPNPGDVGRGFAHAKADFKNQRGLTAKRGAGAQGQGSVGEQIGRAIQLIGFGLADGGAACA